ncbi:FAD-dependent monooxygenase [Streptomyces sp. H27-G5]|uniref:FAD-dependent monooxygenase n=1 Tax=Streptomyces sp. H27-G5 TaxID=2996698 RepID=UPI0022716048|nr:FAD-dependent monooxygenase [Streptomyces sp. H27-G5]MCY0922141.1 FAD-dependent monooxygenase [Streptomyces sp. H27-G5]
MDTDVIIVGAGPTGLMLACELALAGVRTRIIERRTAPHPHSRALTLHPRSVEILDLRGLAPRFLAHGRPVPGWHYAALPTPLDFAALDTRHGYTLAIPQARTEALLEERARELGVRISRGLRLTALTQDADGVTCTVRTADGGPGDDGGIGPGGRAPLRARYVVGCDGGRSPVREAAGIAFPGSDETLTGVLGDFAGLDADPDALRRLRAAGGLAVPLDGGLTRIVLIDPERMRTPSAEPVTTEEFRACLNRLCGSDLGIGEPYWSSRFGNATRLAERYRAGRVLIAGDAAHIHFPAGGQGLNTGLQDAFNLGWKLAADIAGWAPPGLLDSYDAERRPVGRAVTDNTAVQTLLAELTLVPRYADPAVALRTLLDELLGLPEVNRLLAGRVSALATRYPLEGGAPAGRRLPDMALTVAGSSARRAHELFREGRFVLLDLTGSPSGGGPDEPAHPRLTHATVTAHDPHEDLDGVSELLVRPDGHIAWATRTADPRPRAAERAAALAAAIDTGRV